MRLGRSGGLICSNSGTLGVLVRKAGGSDRFILCCSHVIANCGQFNAPFDQVPDSKKVIQQPVEQYCDAKANRVGLLTKNFSRIVPKEQGDTTSDIALALLDPPVAAATSVIQAATGNSIRDFAREDPSEWRSGMPTQLLGASSGAVQGHIIVFNGDNPEFITFLDVGQVPFKMLVRYSTRCEKGDSGGAVIDDQNRLLGIHVAGATAGQNIGLFLPVGNFMTRNGLVMA
jgi:hypothetical protein